MLPPLAHVRAPARLVLLTSSAEEKPRAAFRPRRGGALVLLALLSVVCLTGCFGTTRQLKVTEVSTDKIELFLDYGNKYAGKEVPDPYGGKAADYELALDMIEDGCAGLAQLLIR